MCHRISVHIGIVIRLGFLSRIKKLLKKITYHDKRRIFIDESTLRFKIK